VEIVEIGAYVSLLEYDNIRGMLFSGEITLKRVNFLNRLLSVGKEEVLRVLRVDTQKGFIDLSKKQVKPNEIEECKQKFGKSKAVEGIIKKLSVNTKKSMEYLYKNIIWPLYKTHQHAYDALKALLNGDEHILEGLKITDEIKEELMKILKEKLVAQPVKIKSDFKLTCYSFEGVEAIKESLLKGEKKGTESIPIKFRIIGSPLYECSVTTINKREGIEVMKTALEEVKKNIEEKGGKFLLETNPTVLGENEKSIAEQMKDAANKEEEQSEEEEEEQEEEGIRQVNLEGNEFDITKDTNK
jgi:translation initiation factor 2 subunit 1